VKHKLITARAYDDVTESNSFRILIDRLWPRGLTKEKLACDMWCKDIAPSNELRKSFGHDAEKFADFKKNYQKELNANPAKEDFLKTLKTELEKHNVTLIYAAKDKEISNAAVLVEWLKKQLA
jgi:uncharacterized protein YeaO (DUF488 family)